MQSEKLNTSLEEHGINVKSPLYSRDSLFQGFYQAQPVIIRVQSIDPGSGAAVVAAEIDVIRTLQHPNIVKVLECCLLESYSVVVMEFCASTAESEMEERRKARRYIEEEKMWQLSNSLISALAYMQRHGYVHSCINPASLYVTNSDWKLGNLHISSVNFSSFHGQSYFHSPKVSTALFKSQSSAAHNAYKSGVYSLGLTLLALAKLETPAKIINSGHDVDVINAEVGSCVYSDNFKQLLLEMLKTDEEERGDFLEFEMWLGRNPVSLPTSSRDIKLQEKDRVLEQVSIRREETPVPPRAEDKPVPPRAEDKPVPPRAEDKPVPPRAEDKPVLLRKEDPVQVPADKSGGPPSNPKPKQQGSSASCCTLL